MTSEAPASSNPFPFLVTARKPTAIALGVFAVLFAACAIWWGIWGLSSYKPEKTPDSKEESKGKQLPDELKKDAEKKDAPEKDSLTHSPDYLPAGVWAGLVSITFFGGAFWLSNRGVDATNPAAHVRMELLVFGATFGLLTSLLGFVWAVSWFSSLTDWLNKNDPKQAKWVVLSQGVFFIGLTIMFLSTQLARTEQRNNFLLRRAMYGFNAVFQGILIIYVLAGLNILVFFKIPSTLVTNDAAFTELTPESKKLLKSLDRPVHAYLIMSERHTVNLGRANYTSLYPDSRGLLSQCEDQNKLFKATFLSPSLDKVKINELYSELKIQDRDRLGILLVLGENRDVTSFITDEELLDIARVEAGQQLVYQGESKLMSELAFLTDSRSKLAVYFTQDHGELSIEASGENDRTMQGVANFLKSRKIRVEPLKLDLATPKIPDDAALVVIAGPRQTIPATSPLLKALGEYLKPTASDKKPGKLLVFLPAFRGLDGKVAPTGLESLLAESGVQLENTRLVTIPDSIDLQGTVIPPEYMLGQAFNSQHPLMGSLAETRWLFNDARVLRPTDQPNPALKVTRLLGTPNGFPTWQEKDYTVPPAVTWEAMRADPKGPLLRQKQLTRSPQTLAVAVSAVPTGGNPEKPDEKPRMIVFASDSIPADRSPFPLVPPELRQQVFSDSIDWLREREASIGIKPRTVPIYTLKKPIEMINKVSLLAMISMGLAAMGVGVWYSRRR